jgi:lipopolysaccharide export LptBFGC system permease protein LptF
MGLNMIQEVVWRIVLAALAATALLMVAVWSLPLIALTTGAYPSMPVTVANVLRLLVYLVPEALPVAIPIGLAVGVLAACGGRSVPRRARLAVVLLVIAGTALAYVLFIWIAPLTSQAFRDLAAPRGIEFRLNAPGSVGDRLLRDERWAILCGTAVLAAFALSAAAAARGRLEIRVAAVVASVAYMLLYLPVGVLASTHVLPVSLAVWLPNILYATATILTQLSARH